ncbi:MAG: hypothetical protein IPF57_07700 [Gammaproteobacteria bacterium]|nr:hypothetical protein [Gammaproteobacteria bacterium]
MKLLRDAAAKKIPASALARPDAAAVLADVASLPPRSARRRRPAARADLVGPDLSGHRRPDSGHRRPAEAGSTGIAMSTIDEATLLAYLRCHYRVLEAPPFTLRIGERSAALAALFERSGCDCAAFLTGVESARRTA